MLAPPSVDLRTLTEIESRVLWLATSIVHHANHVRKTPSGVKVGGHQASSASMVSIMTALWFAHLRAADRVSVKPHAAPVLHAIEYLLGLLEPEQLESLRAFGGLQSYPSRLKDPVPADFSTGSVGIGATAPIWSAIAHRYVAGHFEVPQGGRQIALLGDAELDEGACWEALIDPMVPQLGEVTWIVDLNRQSLDRIVPGIAISRMQSMFEAAGWNAITLKWGREVSTLFAEPHGDVLQRRMEDMGNEEYQRLLRSDVAELRERLPGDNGDAKAIRKLIANVDDDLLMRAFRDLGGHDLQLILDGLAGADAVDDRPSVIFAYTIKAHRLPTQGHPANHSTLLTPEQWEQLAVDLGADAAAPWAPFPADSDAGRLCAETATRLTRPPLPDPAPVATPVELGRKHSGTASTQQAFGRFFVDLGHDAPDLAQRVVTVSPDVASSTNLGGWINRVGVWHPGERIDWFADDGSALMKWRESEQGQHIELGIAEGNLVGLMAELGLTWSRDGAPLIPVGTMYDPFVNRALEQWSFGIYSGGQSILVGTPSGVTLAPEGGAHQSIVTPSVGLEQPRCVAWEPASGQDLEWTMLAAMAQIGHPDGSSAYFRLSTRPIDQSIFELPDDPAGREARRRAAVAGGYLLRRADRAPDVTLVGVGAIMPEVVRAADILAEAGYAADVVCLTAPDLVFRALQARRGLGTADERVLDDAFPADRAAPMVTVLDGHPHTLTFLGAIRTVPITSLGVTDFGQSGDVEDLYRYFGIDEGTIVGAALDLVE